MNTIAHFHIHQDTTSNMYVAEATKLGIITQAKSLDELFKNITQSVMLYFEDVETPESKTSSKASILVDYELPSYA